jgi:hypothetical protein
MYSATEKSGTTEISISSSLNMVIGTYHVPNRDTWSFPLTYDYATAANTCFGSVNDDAKDEWGISAKTFKQAVLQGLPIMLDQSKQFFQP